ncbi:MAG: glycosyltransferase family 2 protein [Candidatus Omnitrophica bacterium]|nr:glycosyltransferase family 2 protein [Candidatus Omnitrophota bacterium]MDD5027350.1 glycosyltransferase family 2 protein [Candidatus Omnitrophota bacterium]MDD5661705.1 glycosyltransferase family 2 protein [Candidatus Omnitrophota bacterium]
MKTCIIIPAHNESREIARLVKEIKGQSPDVLVIDDGSTDNTAEIASESGAVVLRNQSNEGKGSCLRKGFAYALTHNFDAAVTMDGDGQHLPQDLKLFITSASVSESGILIGNRMLQTKNMPLVRLLTNRFMSWLISRLCKQDIPDTQCGFRLIKRQVLERIELKTAKFEIETEILLKASRSGFKIDSIPITTVYRGEKSRINPLIDTLRFLKFIIKTDNK